MSSLRRVVKVLVSSPSDIPEIRKLIPFIFMRWSARRSDVLLMPIMWESHSAPGFGGEPQSLLNLDLIPQADLLVALFWSRLGTQTQNFESGTVEEIERFCEVKGAERAMVYFQSKPILEAPTCLNIEELQRLQEYKARIKERSIYHEFSSAEGLEADLHRHLDMKVKSLTKDAFGLHVTSAVLEDSANEHFFNLSLEGTVRATFVEDVLFCFGVQSPKHVWTGQNLQISGTHWRTQIWVKKNTPTTLVCFAAGECGTKQLQFYRRIREANADNGSETAMLLDELSPDIAQIWSRPVSAEEAAAPGPIEL